MNLVDLNVNSLNNKFLDKEPEFILEQSIKKLFKEKIVYVCSFGTESAIILHLISKIKKELPIIMINTHFLFEETLDYKNELLNFFNLSNFKEIFPSVANLKKNDKSGDLWKSDIDKCCNLRKVLPLEKALIPFKAWISGRKSYHMNKRQDLQVFEKINDKVVINPLFNVDRKYIENYFLTNNIPKHPLLKSGYLSIGCTNCTIKSNDIDNPRAGRWSNKIKTECGIHLEKKD